MASIATTSFPPTAPTPSTPCALRSVEGYVLPHLVDVSARAHGRVRSILVAPHDSVRRGQSLVVFDRAFDRSEDDHGAIIINSPVTGLVTRCWATQGEIVAGTWPLLSIASSENVLVVARFVAGNAPPIEPHGVATVLLSGREGDAYPARVMNVVMAPAPCAETGGPDTRSMHVALSFPDAPAKALWPGTPVVVELDP